MKTIFVIILLLFCCAHTCCAEQYIILNNNESFFNEQSDSIELSIRISKEIDNISPSISQLKNLQVLHLLGEASKDRYFVHNVTIPLELLNLPNLHTLVVYNMNLLLPSDVDPAHIQSHIETLDIDNWGSNGAPFLAILPQLRQLYISIGWIYPEIESEKTIIGVEIKEADLSLFLNRLPNLQKLHIWSRGPVPLDENLCTLSNLDELVLDISYSTLPYCMKQQTNLRSVSMPICGRGSSPDYAEKDPLIILASLPNLESLTLWREYSAAIEMPDVLYGFHKLRYLKISGNRDTDLFLYSNCAKDFPDHIMSLNAVIDYPNLELINIGNDFQISNDNINSFIIALDNAWKEGNVSQLEQIIAKETIVWQRPLSREMSGNMLPANW